jgi:hypothetical protein
MVQPRGFFGSLFDFSFSSFVAVKVVGVLYAIGVFFAGVFSIFIAFSGFSKSFVLGIVTILLAPIVFLLYVTGIRVGLEGLVASIRTAENTGRIAENTRPSTPGF